MGKQTGIIQFTGRLGNVIGYRRNGAYLLRTMPDTVRQTVATRRAAHNFGIASRKGKLIRRGIIPQLDILPDGALVNRLNKAIIETGVNSLQGFQCNKYTGVEKFFCIPPVISKNGTIKIPAQELPEIGTHLEVKAIGVRINFIERKVTGSTTETIMIDLATPFNGAELIVMPPGKGTLLLLLQVRAFKDGIATENRRFKAADILGVTTQSIRKKKLVKTPALRSVLPYEPQVKKPNNIKVAGYQRE